MIDRKQTESMANGRIARLSPGSPSWTDRGGAGHTRHLALAAEPGPSADRSSDVSPVSLLRLWGEPS